MKKADGKENRATVDASKAKEENLEVAGGKCWRGFWLSALNVTGEIFNQFQIKVIFVTKEAKESARNMMFQSQNLNISQRPGSCLLPSFLLWSPTQSSPLSSTTLMADFNSFVFICSDRSSLRYGVLFYNVISPTFLIFTLPIDVFDIL